MYTKFLQDKFGYPQFREKQLGIIRKIIERKEDVCGIMYTGLGKSLCFQYIPTYLNKTAIVISPLIALMNDQKAKLDKLGIPSCCLNSTTVKRAELIKSIKGNQYRIVYLTPEYITRNTEFITSLVDLDVLCLITVDEAHIISNWGTNFRPEYRELHILRELAPNIPILALTATATPKVQEDIINILELRNPYVVKTTFDRPNLSLSIKQKMDKESDLLQHVRNDDPVIIYAKTHKDTESISKFLIKSGINCDYYHGGMGSKEREIVHNKFINGEISCVVATIAFGMGIDIPIRKVIHYCVSEDIESYYQEIGRAGRDGKPAECVMYYGNQDLTMTSYLISLITVDAVKNQKLLMFRNMVNYLSINTCRRKYILNYFGEKYDINCGSCDICSRNIVNTDSDSDININEDGVLHDITDDSLNILTTTKLTKGIYGTGTIVGILCGNCNKKEFLRELTTFGKYPAKKKKYLDALVKLLIINGYLEMSMTGFYSTIKISKVGNSWLINKDISKKIKVNVPISILELFDNKVIKKVKVKSDKNDNKGGRWSTEEIDELYSHIKNKKTIKEIAISHKRSDGAIRTRIRMLITTRLINGETISQIANSLNKTDNEIMKLGDIK